MGRSIWLVTSVLVVLSMLVACAPASPTIAPAKSQTAAPAAAQPTIGATGASQPAAKIKRGGTMVMAYINQASSLDPILDTLGPLQVQIGVYNSLLRYEVTDFKAGKLELQPELAESWERVSPTELVFKLRKGVKFHDGSDFNAEVAKWSLERMANHPKSNSKRLGENFDSMQVVDPNTLRVKYKRPSALQLLNLTPATGGTGAVGSLILSKANTDKMGEQFLEANTSGTGPFKLVQFQRDNEVILAKNPDYWEKGADSAPLPYLDGMRHRLITDNAVIITELKAGSVHLSPEMRPNALAMAKADPVIQILQVHWAPRPWYYAFNYTKEPFGKNLKLRQAAEYAIDKESAAKVLGQEVGSPNYFLGWIKSWPGYDESLPHYDFNVDKATSLMKEAGYPNGVDVTLLTYTDTTSGKIAEIVQSMWAKVGIRVKIDAVEVVAARQKIKAGDSESHVYNYSHSPDPDLFSRAFTCDGAANWGNLCNKDMDKCMADGREEIDLAKRSDIYKRCQRILYEDAFMGGIHQESDLMFYRPEAKGIRMQSFIPYLKEAWLDK
jgi:peptide/nickel transport system substrate-binding protein